MENQFIKQGTKTSCIVASVIAGIALISLIMLLLLLQNDAGSKAIIAFFFSVGLAFLLTLWFGILQIKVFTDYKNQRKYLCAEGIFIICLTALITITAILFGILQSETAFLAGGTEGIDIRWFIGIFLLGFTIWKAVVVSIALKEKRFNWWLELAIAILWLAFSVLTIISIFLSGNALTTLLWGFVIVAWVLIIVYIYYLLASYIFKKPDYLETSEAFEILKKETANRNARIARANAMMGNFGTQPEEKTATNDDLESKLKKLDTLLQKQIITKEEYDEKRKQIIKDSL